ncbi:SHOCT domain-containing protein [Nonomuraea insulae]|uniref:SHOCT domain-containing protein n=1 Tax=Nonomuraea insulae TaxID=1616787 RepID=A0ABW1D3Q4_9ACTN
MLATILASAPPKPVRGSEVAELIARLGELRDAGVLSEEEFPAKKAELLSRL